MPDDNNRYELPQIKIRLKVAEGNSLYSSSMINTPQDAVLVMADMMKDLDREYVCVVNLDNRNRPINFNVVSVGSINESVVPMQNIFKAAILSNATSCIALHNHPSGDLNPSKEDIMVTQKMIEAGRLLDIPILDHVIISGFTGDSYSMREEEEGILSFHESSNGYSVKESSEEDWRKRRQERMTQLTQQLEEGVRNIFESENYERYLSTLAKFTRYSVRNTVLIDLQSEGKASYVAGYKAWQTKFHRQVKKGAKALQILAPIPYKQTMEQDRLDPNTGLPVRLPDGSIQKEKVQVKRTGFKIENVFDISDTYGEPLPTVYQNIEGDVNRFDQFVEAMKKVSPVPIEFKSMEGKDGYFSLVEKKIYIRDDMSQRQTVAALIHEATHASIHDIDLNHLKESIKERGKDTRVMEQEAESVAWVVAKHFGIDTDANSFGYICLWSKDKELKELQNSLQTIRDTSLKFIDGLEKELTIMRKEELAVDPFLNNDKDMYAIYQLNDEDKDISYRFRNTEYIERNEIKIRTGDYQQVYTGILENEVTLDDLYEKFNLYHPEDYHAHSLSISDVVAIRREGEEMAYYVDNFGFKELEDFLPHLRNPESTIQDFEQRKRDEKKSIEFDQVKSKADQEKKKNIDIAKDNQFVQECAPPIANICL